MTSKALGGTILVVDDEPEVVALVTTTLHRAGYNVIAAGDGSVALERARHEHPALIVLDLFLPQLSGWEVCKLLKKEEGTRQIPIVMLSCKAETQDRVLGLELGAEDYITKPFSPRELTLRVAKALGHSHDRAATRSVLSVGPITMDRLRSTVSINNRQTLLTNLEHKLLAAFLERPGEVLLRDVLLSEIWGYEAALNTRTLDTHVRRLRSKLGDAGEMIETVRGYGYRLSAVSVSPPQS
jgi:two-component system, OmpR family, phosphate regulon response regulator PhoB